MRKLYIKSGFTLVELVVALFLVSLIILGIFSVNMVLNNNNQDYGQRYFVKSNTQSVLNHILNNAALAIGSGNVNDEPFLSTANGAIPSSTNPPDPATLCIHQAGISGGFTGNNPLGASNDVWLCYDWYPFNSVNGTPYTINWCEEVYGPQRSVPVTVDPRGASSCANALATGNLTYRSSVYYLGTSYISPVASYSFNSNAQQPAPTFSVTLMNCLNNNDLVHCSSNGSTDQVNNPSVTLSGSTTPYQVSI